MFDLITFKRLFAQLNVLFTERRADLNALDAAIGDGDHGDTMQRAMQAAAEASQGEFPDLGKGFDAVAAAIAEYAGGAIGPVLAAFFAEGGLVLAGKQSAELDDFQRFFAGGQEAVGQIGGAQIGDKTLLDALAPASQALSESKQEPLLAALEAAANAAEKAAQATRDMVAAQGRAHFLGERSKGHPDPGASSFAMIVAGFSKAIKDEVHPELEVAEEPISNPPSGKLINQPEDIVAEDNLGLALAYPGLLRKSEQGILIRAKEKAAGKVGLAMGHGGGHTPSMGGFVGPGLLDADVYGPVFTCASGVRIADAIAQADKGAGVALLVSNHSGDVLNARLALRRASQRGTTVKAALLGDDIATAPREQLEKRRGLGGLLFALKIGGAAAERNASLEEVITLMENVNERTATLAVAVSAPTHPASGIPLFELPKGEIEIGTGVHGEVGVYRGPQLPVNEIVDMLLEKLLADLNGLLNEEVLLFVNGAGGTSDTELHITFQRAQRQLEAQGLKVASGVVGSFFTTQEMGGFSLSLCAATEDLMADWNAPASGAAFRWPYE